MATSTSTITIYAPGVRLLLQMKDLPTELHRMTLAYLSKRDWQAIALTCRFLADLAQEFLFKDVCVSLAHKEHENFRYKRFRDAIFGNSRLADLVRTLYIRGFEEEEILSRADLPPLLRKLSKLTNLETRCLDMDADLLEAIQELPNLRYVMVYGSCTITSKKERREVTSQAKMWSGKVEAVCFPFPGSGEDWMRLIPLGLQHLTLWPPTHSYEPAQSFDIVHPTLCNITTLHLVVHDPARLPDNFVELLRATAELRRFTLDKLDSDTWDEDLALLLSLPRDAIPLLEEYNGPAECAEAFITGRPVHTVLIWIEEDTPSDILGILHRSTVPVTNLEVCETNAPDSLPSLLLELAPTSIRQLLWEDEPRTLLSRLPVLSRMSDLSLLGCLSEDYNGDFIAAVSVACKSLQTVEFRDLAPTSTPNEIWRRKEEYRWTCTVNDDST